jgi:hypothetical protein
MRRNKELLTGVITVLTLLLTPLPAARAAESASGGLALTFTGLPSGVSKVLVELESPLTTIGSSSGEIELYPLTVVRTGGALSMTVPVPPSRLLESVAAAQHGHVNLFLAALSATRTYTWFTPAKVNPAGVTAESIGGSGWTSSRRRLADLPDVGRTPCGYRLISNVEVTTRIGELHVAVQQGVMGWFHTGTTADNTVSVGVSASGGGFNFSGYITISNSISASGGFGRAGFLDYVDGHVYYGKYQAFVGDCIWGYVIEATSSVGDAYPGSQTPPIEPYPRCMDDPNGYAVVAPENGYWGDDRSTAYNYHGIASVFGFDFDGSDGFTSDIYESWDDHGPSPTFVCGNVNPVQDSSIFYDGDI